MTDSIRVVEDDGGISWYTADDVLALQREIAALNNDLNQANKCFEDAREQWMQCREELSAALEQKPVAVPEPINECAKPDAWNRGYGAGWNDCRDKTLKLNAAHVPSQDAIDAERYRWLRELVGVDSRGPFMALGNTTTSASDTDAAIDAAILASKGGAK
jgi:hypothetical protein